MLLYIQLYINKTKKSKIPVTKKEYKSHRPIDFSNTKGQEQQKNGMKYEFSVQFS